MTPLRLGLAALVLWLLSTPLLAEKPNDAMALTGVTAGRVVFDINTTQAGKLSLYLQVIRETHADLQRQGVTPEMVLAFRGKAVTLVTTDRQHQELTEYEDLDRVAEQIKELQGLGARMEGCSIATRLYGVDNQTLLPGITPVGNTFVSLIGYQARGYALIPIY